MKKKHLAEVDRKVSELDDIASKATPFVKTNTKLMNGPLEEITIRETDMAQHLTTARAAREQLLEEYAHIEKLNNTHRERVLKGSSENA